MSTPINRSCSRRHHQLQSALAFPIPAPALAAAVAVALLLAHAPGAVPSALAWTFDAADSGPGIGAYSSLEVGPAGELHIAYFAGSQGFMKYAFHGGIGWTTEIVDNQYLTGHHTSIDLDSQARPIIAYRFYSGPNVRTATQTEGGAWSFSNFETDPDMETDITMELDGADLPHVAYYDGFFHGESHDLRYARFDGSQWITSLVDAAGEVGRGSAIALDSAGRPHISYYDETNVLWKHAHFDGSQWIVTVLDDVEFIAFNFRTAITVDAIGRVHAVASAYHYDGANWRGRLRYALKDGPGWTVSTIEQAAANRDLRIPAITTDAANHPHVSYLLYYNVEPITGDLKYARFDGVGWRIEFIDTGDIADSDFSNDIALDASGRPHVSYARSGVLIHAVGDAPADVAVNYAPRSDFSLGLPAPHPIRAGAETILPFILPSSGPMDLAMYDASGSRVASLATGWHREGAQSISVELPLAAGVYFARLSQGERSVTRRLVIR